MKWKTGDWCFYEYKLAQITRAEKGVPREVKDGMFCTSGDLSYSCRPLTLVNSAISKHAEYWSDRLHADGHGGLNYPDIHRKMVDLWAAACDANAGKERDAACQQITDFANAILEAVRNSGSVMGVRLLRQ